MIVKFSLAGLFISTFFSCLLFSGNTQTLEERIDELSTKCVCEPVISHFGDTIRLYVYYNLSFDSFLIDSVYYKKFRVSTNTATKFNFVKLDDEGLIFLVGDHHKYEPDRTYSKPQQLFDFSAALNSTWEIQGGPFSGQITLTNKEYSKQLLDTVYHLELYNKIEEFISERTYLKAFEVSRKKGFVNFIYSNPLTEELMDCKVR